MVNNKPERQIESLKILANRLQETTLLIEPLEKQQNDATSVWFLVSKG